MQIAFRRVRRKTSPAVYQLPEYSKTDAAN